MENWSVYAHIFPNNKYYIGITSQNVEYRWNRGNGYKSQNIIRSPETKRKMSKPKSAETIEKMKKAQRLRREKEYLNKMKEYEVARVDPDRIGGQ